MKPSFQHLNPDNPGVQEVMKYMLSRRQFLVLGTGSFVTTLMLSNFSEEAESAPNIAVSSASNSIKGEVKTMDIQPTNPDYFIPDRFQGKTILITGAATGIGSATAIRAAREGANVVGVDRKEKELNQTISKIKGEGHKAIAIVGNVVETALCDRMIAEAVKTFGSIDLALNAAGVMDGGDPAQPLNFDNQRNLLPNSIHLATDEYWDAVIATNTTGVFKSMRSELRQMLGQGKGGAIVNIGSIAGLTGLAGNPAYVASKHGVTGLTRNAALDYAPYGIRINSVNMAATDTPMVARAGEFVQATKKAGEGGSMGGLKVKSILSAADSKNRSATVWEQGAIILFLLSQDASNLTGCTYATDGGWTAY
ncbi:SDR family NAD(P)-dependent oxidoreductase [Aerosakkonemataceae cyanobacterium BLCC-F154]|uniref:SDR family NAD(P)-dependent oxidoreductase n=1 Tax=Floridaenema fluviatile BLCC-F154 TaxID=3153640 RepID=A0ABV4YL12_9CYAN